MVVAARRAGLSISKTADLLGFSHTTISRLYIYIFSRRFYPKQLTGYTFFLSVCVFPGTWTHNLCSANAMLYHWATGTLQKIPKKRNIQWAAVVWTKIPCWCQRRMGRLVRDDGKATATQITTRCNQGMQNTISERTTRRTLNQMRYSSRRLHRVPLLSAKNRTRRIQFAQAHQNWTIEDWKNVAWSDESQFLLRHSDGRVRILHKKHESMDPSCLVSTVQAGGGGAMVWGIFFWHTLGL